MSHTLMAAEVLPADLEQQIFETAAILHPPAIPSLLLVARRVLVWIEPFLYRVVRLEDSPRCRSLMKAIKSGSKPPSFFRASVRHLHVCDFWSAADLVATLKVCTRIVDFFCLRLYLTPSILPLLGEIRPARLIISLGGLFGHITAIDPKHPAFTRMTHLDVCDSVAHPGSNIYTILPQLPAMTHLCLNFTLPWSAIDKLLTECPSLELLVNLWGEQHGDLGPAIEHAKGIPFYDERFVIAFAASYWAQWEAGARGLPNFWTRAADFVAKKRRGEVDPSCYVVVWSKRRVHEHREYCVVMDTGIDDS